MGSRTVGFVVILALGCGDGASSPQPVAEITQVSFVAGTGCAPPTFGGETPKVYAVGGSSLRFQLHLDDSVDHFVRAEVPGRPVRLFRVDEHGEPTGGAVASGVFNGQGLGVIDWAPVAQGLGPGGVQEIELLAEVGGMELGQPFLAEVLQPFAVDGNIVCAYLSNSDGVRIPAVTNGQVMTIRAVGLGLPSDATYRVNVIGNEWVSGPSAGNGLTEVTFPLELLNSHFDGANTLELSMGLWAERPSEPAYARTRGVAVEVRR
jgi:hypothetical protein